MLCLLLVAIAVTLLFLQYRKMCDYWKIKGVTHLKPLPLFGNMLPILLRQKSLIEIATEVYCAAPNARYVGYHQFSKPILMIRDPELIKQILIKDFDIFAEHNAAVPEEVDPLWTNGLFASNAQKWKELRPKLSPAFTSNKMRIMFVLMEECAEQFVNYFIKQDLNSNEVELKDIFSRFATDVIATTAFGIKCDSMFDRNNEFHKMGTDLTNFKGIRSLKFLLYSISPLIMKIFNVKILPKTPAEYFQSIIYRTVKEREIHNIKRPDMIDLLLEARKYGLSNENSDELRKLNITDFEIASQAMIFFLAGFETASSTMCFTVYELAVNIAVQEKLIIEIDAIEIECDGKLTYEAITKMKYMDMVISESLRKWGQAVMIDRKALKPYTIQAKSPDEKTITLKTSDVVMMPMYMIQRDEKYFKNSEIFDPERFSDENRKEIVNGTYFPFGMGPRTCIGSRFALLEIKILLFHLFRRFTVEPCYKTTIPLQLDRTSITLHPKGGFWVQLKRRSDKK